MYAHRSRIAALACLLASCSSDPVSPGTEPTPAAPTGTRWRTTPSSQQAELYELWISTADSLRLTEFEQDSTKKWKLTNVMLAGKILEHAGSRLRLGSLEGKLAGTSRGKWIRLDTSHGRRILMLASYRLEALEANPQTMIGQWFIEDHHKVGTGTVEIRSDKNWLFTSQTKFESGTWSSVFPTKGRLDSSGIDPSLSEYLALKPSLQLFNSIYLVEETTTGIWMDQWGDQAALALSLVR
ncbi:MAG: hypothetical protein IPK50_21185 [Fibrobacterota bacterium]|nr:MAG: hypothetical protein IPK50_21185 [Fibrobacterota bacterium]